MFPSYINHGFHQNYPGYSIRYLICIFYDIIYLFNEEPLSLFGKSLRVFYHPDSQITCWLYISLNNEIETEAWCHLIIIFPPRFRLRLLLSLHMHFQIPYANLLLCQWTPFIYHAYSVQYSPSKIWVYGLTLTFQGFSFFVVFFW